MWCTGVHASRTQNPTKHMCTGLESIFPLMVKENEAQGMEMPAADATGR